MHKLIAAIFLGCLDVGFAQTTWKAVTDDDNYNLIMEAIHGPAGSRINCSKAATSFTQPTLLPNTDLTYCTSMFQGCSFDNTDLRNFAEKLNTRNVKYFQYAFKSITNAGKLNLKDWVVSSGLQFYQMFMYADSFTSNLSIWDVSKGKDFESMFYGLSASSFNSDLLTWDVSSGTNFNNMFNRASSFESDLSSWDVSSGTTFRNMFNDASSFESDLSSWNVSKGTNFDFMFYKASSFNSDLSAWGPKLNANLFTSSFFSEFNSSSAPVNFAKTCWYDFDAEVAKNPLNKECGCKENEYVHDKVCIPCDTGYTNFKDDDPFSTDTECNKASSLPAKKKVNPWIIIGASLGSLAVIAGLAYGAKQYKMFAPFTKINSNAGFETLLKL